MSHKRKGQLTVSGEWKKHLRKYFKRVFWKGERQFGKKIIRAERNPSITLRDFLFLKINTTRALEHIIPHLLHLKYL